MHAASRTQSLTHTQDLTFHVNLHTHTHARTHTHGRPAVAGKKNVVGTLSVDIPAATERTTTHEVLIKTTTQAFAGLVHDCVRR